MTRYDKVTRKKRRELSGESYERELGEQLNELLDRFHDWKNGAIESSELSDFIHKFHNGVSREIYKLYNFLPEEDIVARALVLDYLTEDEVPENIIEQISPRIEIYKQKLDSE